ncbi:fla cluster protein FlaF [Halobellus rubicundus]|uniref:Fla cluster protein FlaF n=1 Tax=Halobellus rubicundus TaxID=2996466 RepID=A0ABD5MED7_9EURY
MGFGVSGSTAVIFLGVLIASGTLYTAAAGSAEQLSEARDEKSEDLLDRRNTAIDVTSVVYNASGNNDLVVNATNDGTTTLSVADTSLLVDNEYAVPDETSVDGDGDTDVWAAGQTLTLTVRNVAQPDGVTVVAQNGVSSTNTTVEGS